MEKKTAKSAVKPRTPGSVNAAKSILEMVASGKLTTDPAKLAKYIEMECGIHYLAHGCQEALALDAVKGDVEKQIRIALAWAGYPEDAGESAPSAGQKPSDESEK